MRVVRTRRLADARAGQNQNGAVERLHRLALRLVEAFEIARRSAGAGARGKALRVRRASKRRSGVAQRRRRILAGQIISLTRKSESCRCNVVGRAPNVDSAPAGRACFAKRARTSTLTSVPTSFSGGASIARPPALQVQ